MRKLALLALVVLAGCPRHRLELGPQGEVADAKQMLALLAKQDGRFVTVEGDVRLKVNSPQGSGTVGQFIAVTRPAGLHLETFNFFGKTLSVLTSDGESFALYDADKNVFYSGPATTEAMSRFLPVALAPEEATALLLGQVPRLPATDGKLVLDAAQRRYELTLQVGEATQVLFIDPKELDITKSVITGVSSYDLTLEDYRPEPGGRFPHTLTLEAKGAKVTLTYRYTDVKVNAAPNLSLFRQEPPPSAQRIPLDAQGRPVAR